jgi:acetate CoA/acetoacetate CoA-transferase beta subunit
MCVLDVLEGENMGLVMSEINPEFTVDDVKAATEADFVFSDQLKSMV